MAEAESVGQADAVLLTPLTEDTFLHNLHIRYKRDIIYTAVGNALVSLNPCRALPLYSAELAREYLARAPHLLPPHVYAVAAAAYRWVRDRDESQCIVITGESGAGKTEAARVCLQCVVLGGAGGAGGALAAAGTLLEAFGNAATARNHNASRFGKLLEVELGAAGEPVGGHVTHYLLEKERAAAAAPGERNFHVLYQLLAGAEPHLLKRLRLQRSWEQYRILRGARGAGASPRRAAPHDRDHFAFTMVAMEALGLGGEDGAAVLRLLAFVLKLGNVEFEPQHNIDGSMRARVQRPHELREACALVGVAAEALADALGAAGAESAEALRDRLVCALYARLFTWLVDAVNDALRAPAAGARAALGILDMYGFECLAHNGLERLLINYAAERVQAAVTGATLRREQQLYAAEGVPWRALPYTDHELLADLLDAGPDSVLGALHECAARGASDATFLQRLARRRHPRLRVLPPDRFQVAHFGGAVEYCARGLLAHERDALCGRCTGALGAAREPLLAALFAPPHEDGPRRPATLSWRQRALLGALVRRLPPAPRLVRCVRAAPPPELRPQRLEAAYVRRQLRDQGIVEMALLRRSGWCESMCARSALARYGVLRDARAAAAGGVSPMRAARALLRALPIPDAEFTYGRTRVFIRSPRSVWELEALRAARVHELVAAAQRAWRRHRTRRHAAAATIARAWRASRARHPHASHTRARAVERLWRCWCMSARRRYLAGLWRRLPARHMSPACAAWPPCPSPRLLGRADALLRHLHHAWRCRLYRAAFDQTARNRMREKVTASVLFKERKLSYARSVPHPFVGDYVRLRASAAWRRGPGAAPPDRYVVFADVVGKVARASGRVSRCLCVVSTGALLLLEARSLRLKRRVPAQAVYRLSLSPLHDDLLVVHVRACGAPDSPPEEASQWSSRGSADAAGCLFGGEGARRRRGDVVVRAGHVLELATKLFLVVQNAAGAPPLVNIAAQFDANFGQQLVTFSFHAVGAEGGARLLRRGSRMDVLV